MVRVVLTYFNGNQLFIKNVQDFQQLSAELMQAVQIAIKPNKLVLQKFYFFSELPDIESCVTQCNDRDDYILVHLGSRENHLSSEKLIASGWQLMGMGKVSV